MSDQSKYKIQDIEYLRAFAILFTLISHLANNFSPPPAPFDKFFFFILDYFKFTSGVDLFFCISGFVIFRSFLKSQQSQPHLSAIKTTYQFWLKRAVRILPSAWLWLLIYYILSKYFNSMNVFGELENNISDIWSAFFQYANIRGHYCWGPIKTINCGRLGWYWSLSLEEQFYIILPFVFFVSKKYFKYILGVALVFQLLLPRPNWDLFSALKSDALIAGILIYMFSKEKFYKKIEPVFLNKFNWTQILTLISLLALLAFTALYPRSDYNNSLVTIVSAVLVWLASYDSGYIFSNRVPILSPVLRWFGSRSYSIYLVHGSLYYASFSANARVAPYFNFSVIQMQYFIYSFALGGTFIISELNYRFFEKPIQKHLVKKFNL